MHYVMHYGSGCGRKKGPTSSSGRTTEMATRALRQFGHTPGMPHVQWQDLAPSGAPAVELQRQEIAQKETNIKTAIS